ncbi:MAG: DUF4198 domain-containing protein [Acidobacteriota bacterium]|nr:DUF4198 domain-containing protein [Acidobacteriota bacterium]
MKKQTIFAGILSLSLVASIFAHDLFLKMDSFFLQPNSKYTLKVMNGTFQASEGAVSFARLNDVSVVSAGKTEHPKETDFTKDETTAFMNLKTGAAGTYVVGLSTKHREIALKAADFNEYLKEDGLPDTLEERRKTGELAKDAKERYSKHVKAILQVGKKQTDDYKTVLNYPVELVPQQNPYKMKRGGAIEILCLKDGKPLAGQVVLAGREEKGKIVASPELRSDANGIVKVPLVGAGKWFVKFINMTKLDDPNLNYESKWTTLTFEIK